MEKTYYHIASDFSETPGGRFRKNGPHSGEEFRDDVLIKLLDKAIQAKRELVIVLDGTSGYGSSFLEEVFGGLIRLGRFERDLVKKHLAVKANEPLYKTYQVAAARYMDNACSAERAS